MRAKEFIIKDLILNHKEWNSVMDLLSSCPSRSSDIIHKDMNSYSYEERKLIEKLDNLNGMNRIYRGEINGAK